MWQEGYARLETCGLSFGLHRPDRYKEQGRMRRQTQASGLDTRTEHRVEGQGDGEEVAKCR